MSTILILLFALIASITALTNKEYIGAFNEFKAKFSKTYLSADEEAHRFEAFKNNLDFVNSWDAEARGFTVGINKFADLTTKEFAAIYNGVNITRNPVKRSSIMSGVTSQGQAGGVTVDWRTKGAVTPIKDQGQCGSCWSFSSTGSMEGAWFLAKGQLVSLSEQNLMDCSTAQGNQGCNGGLMDQAFQYVISNNGDDTEASYPYTATGPNSCQFSSSNVGATISSYTDVTSGDENALATAVMQQPVSVAIDASNQSFQLYTSGVYYEPACSSTSLDHGVLAIGYGTDNSGTDYWIVKNSWGTSWGMSGYINMSRNKNNNCGIATSASWPKV